MRKAIIINPVNRARALPTVKRNYTSSRVEMKSRTREGGFRRFEEFGHLNGHYHPQIYSVFSKLFLAVNKPTDMNEPTTKQLMEGLLESKIATLKTCAEHTSAMLQDAEDLSIGENDALGRVESALDSFELAAKCVVEIRFIKYHFRSGYFGLKRQSEDKSTG